MGDSMVPIEADRFLERRGCLTTVVILWSAALLAVGFVAFQVIRDDSFCETDQDSLNSGERTWSLFPPGPQCTFTVERNGFDEVRGPTPLFVTVEIVYAAAVLSSLSLCVYLLRSPFNRDGSLRGHVSNRDE